MIVLSGARIFDGENFLLEHAVVVEGERIAAIVPYAERPQGAARDLAGGLLAPGYIDVQVNGGGGVLFNEDPTPEAIARIAAAHRKHGTVGLLPMLVTHLSFREIGEAMFLSPNTVKSQAISLYRKLGASSRSQAVTRSRELGLLDG